MSSSTEITRWGDDAMFSAQPMQRDEAGRVEPRVYLLSATPDPLGALAAGFRMYAGKPVYSLDELTDEDRRWAWEESLSTHLKAPWEFIDFMFMIEGVTRAFTHQMVRQRTACYAQESLRFAVKEGLAEEVPVPPSVVGDENAVAFWGQAIKEIERSYKALISLGIPAEDARGLLPHATTTRLIYKTNFRGLMEHAGNRLCTQAQFEWRYVFLGIMNAIRDYRTPLFNQDWQFKLLATPRAETFAPVCYKAGKCVFMGELDRGCTIRDRVTRMSDMGAKPSEWADPIIVGEDNVIKPIEWMADPFAGITNEHNRRPQ